VELLTQHRYFYSYNLLRNNAQTPFLNQRATERTMSEQTQERTIPHVYTAIAAVMDEISKAGISKDRKNDQQGYNFRGIDDVYNAMAPILAKNGLCILPVVKNRDVVERTTARGSVLFYVTVHVDFQLVSSKDGSSHTISVVGEAMDSGDKATNKAMSAAFKYACMQAFCIPTEGDNDADKTTHADIKPRAPVRRVEKVETPFGQVEAPDASATIGADELATIMKLATEAGVDLQKIADAYGVPKIEALPKINTAAVVAKLQEKIATAKAAA
jgi:hypothetical protein